MFLFYVKESGPTVGLGNHLKEQGSMSKYISLPNSRSTVVCKVSILPLVSGSSNLFFRFLGTVSKAPTTMSITVTFMFQNSFISLTKFGIPSGGRPWISHELPRYHPYIHCDQDIQCSSTRLHRTKN